VNWLKYRNAQDFLDATGLSVEDCLKIVDAEIKQLKQ